MQVTCRQLPHLPFSRGPIAKRPCPKRTSQSETPVSHVLSPLRRRCKAIVGTDAQDPAGCHLGHLMI